MSETAILTLEPAQAAEVRELMRQAYLTSSTVFGELRCGPKGDVQLLCGLQDTARSKQIQQILTKPTNGPARPSPMEKGAGRGTPP